MSQPKLDTKCKNCHQLIFWDKDYANWYHLYEGYPQKKCILPPQIAEPVYRGEAHEIRQGYVVVVTKQINHTDYVTTHRFTNIDDVAPFVDAPGTDVYEIIKRPYVP